MILAYRYKIYPNKAQAAALSEMLRDFCYLYNSALEHRIRAYEKGASISCYDQIRALPQIRREMANIGRWSATAEQQVMRKLDKSFNDFYGRIKSGKKGGFPRFKSWRQYHAADFRVGNGLVVRGSAKLRMIGVPAEIKVRWHRKMPSTPKSAILSRNGANWFIIFHVEVAAAERASYGSVGIDVGLTNIMAFSNGETIARPRWAAGAARKLRILQRALSRCKRGSNARSKRKAALAKINRHVAACRKDFLHKESRKIVNRFGRIAIEDLNIRPLSSGFLAKEVNDAAWAILTEMLTYKAANAGGEVIKVSPRGTSQMCPSCGTMAKKTLKQRTHECACGCVLDRDVAAAMVIHDRAFGFRPGIGHGSLSEPIAA